MARATPEITTRVQNRLGISTDPAATDILTITYSPGRIVRVIQEGYYRLCLTAKLLWVRAPLGDVAHQPLYSLPADLQLLERCVWDNRRIPPIPQDALMFSDAQFNTKEGDVFGYMVQGDGTSQLRKLNVPSQTNATKFQIEYYKRHLIVSNLDPLQIPNRYITIVEYYVCWKLFEADGPMQDLTMADHYKSRWETGLATIERRKGRFWNLRTRVSAPTSIRGIKLPAPRLPSHYPSRKR